MNEEPGYVYVWHWRKRLPRYFGRACRLVAWGKSNCVVVEFEDGFRVLTSRYSIRRVSGPPDPVPNPRRVRPVGPQPTPDDTIPRSA